MNLLIVKRYILISGFLAYGLAGCSSVVGERGYLHNRTAEYVVGQSVPPLKMPVGVKPIPEDPYYDIPKISRENTGNVVLYPPGSLLMKQAQKQSSTSSPS